MQFKKFCRGNDSTWFVLLKKKKVSEAFLDLRLHSQPCPAASENQAAHTESHITWMRVKELASDLLFTLCVQDYWGTLVNQTALLI